MVKWIYKLTDISNIKRISFRQDINGLRAIAVLAVVFYHAELELFKGGWLGVDIFFVISGYLISNIIISELNEGTFSFKGFYIRRVRRILPALFSTLLLTIPFAYFFLTPKAMDEYIDSLNASVFFYANYHFMNIDFYVAESTKLMPLLHTWSLAIEEQYYLLFPLLAFIVYKYFKKYFSFFIGLITVSSLYLNILSQFTDKFYRLEFRIWELLLGVLVMILSSNFKIKHLEKIGLPLMLFPIFYFGDDWISDVEPKLIALIGISLIIFSNTDSSILTKVLSFNIISKLGLCSYSIYLLHQPLFAFFRIYKNRSFENYLNNNTEILKYELFLLIIGLFLLGFFNYKYIEIGFKKNISLKYLLGLFILVIFSIFGLSNVESRYFQDDYLTQVSNLDRNTFSIDGLSCHNRELNNLCYLDNSSDVNILALGDSSLRSISYWLAKGSVEAEFNFSSITGSLCLFNFDSKITEGSCPYVDYEELNNFVSKITNSVIVYSGRLPLYESGTTFYNSIVKEPGENFEPLIEIEREIEKTILRIIDNNNIVILIYPIPEQGWNVPYLFNFKDLDINDTVSYPANIWHERRNPSYEILDSIKSDSIFRVYPEEIFCDSFVKNECVGAFEGTIFYSDDDHLSLDGGELITEQIIEVIEYFILEN
jgi:peptidoglycan/LPS O-acetylase OafA/YrhL